MEERLVTDWLLISNIIRNNRIINDLPYREVIVIAILKRHNCQMTFKDLTIQSKILKSQLNKTLNNLEKKQFIVKKINEFDHRSKMIYLTEEGIKEYDSFHPKALQLGKEIIDILGNDNAETLALIFEKVIKEQDKLK